ncbi:hypothetical protein BurJ1DRAFT_1056 [Burkholderiales bacterium JOSHI_001]|nr:hypothetical protein BurJ1DRAFT_1056 [Burkholderiales bacterium JOSHI_001]
MSNKLAGDSGAHLVDQAALKAEHAIASTRRLANEAMDGLAGSVEDLRSTAAPALSRVAEQAGALTQSGVDAVLNQSHRLADKARQAGDGTVRYIQHQPVKSMLMAAATGAALMALLSLVAGRRNDR